MFDPAAGRPITLSSPKEQRFELSKAYLIPITIPLLKSCSLDYYVSGKVSAPLHLAGGAVFPRQFKNIPSTAYLELSPRNTIFVASIVHPHL